MTAFVLCALLTILMIWTLQYHNFLLFIAFSAIQACVLLSFGHLHAKLYNQLHNRRKFIFLKDNTNVQELLTKICSVPTPYGAPSLILDKTYKAAMPGYFLEDLNWLIYFWTKEDRILIYAKCLCRNPEASKRTAGQAYIFTQQLTDLFSYIINTGRRPGSLELERIFSSDF